LEQDAKLRQAATDNLTPVEPDKAFGVFQRKGSSTMPYALFENEFRLSRTFPTATDVWRCAEDCGLVVDNADGEQRLDEGYSIKPCAGELGDEAEPGFERTRQKT